MYLFLAFVFGTLLLAANYILFSSMVKKIDDLECHLRDTQGVMNITLKDFESVGTTINMKLNNAMIPIMKFEARIIELNNILKDEQKSDDAGPNTVA